MPPPTTPPVSPSTTAYLLINGKLHSSKIDTDLRHSSQDRHLRLYITERKEWAPATLYLIHWPTIHQTCMNRSTNHQKRAAVKLSFRQWATDTELRQKVHTKPRPSMPMLQQTHRDIQPHLQVQQECASDYRRYLSSP